MLCSKGKMCQQTLIYAFSLHILEIKQIKLYSFSFFFFFLQVTVCKNQTDLLTSIAARIYRRVSAIFMKQ